MKKNLEITYSIITPNKHIDYYNKGCKLKKSGDFYGAINAYNKAIEYNPFEPLYRISRAEIYLKIKHQEEARKDIISAKLSINSKNSSSFLSENTIVDVERMLSKFLEKIELLSNVNNRFLRKKAYHDITSKKLTNTMQNLYMEDLMKEIMNIVNDAKKEKDYTIKSKQKIITHESFKDNQIEDNQINNIKNDLKKIVRGDGQKLKLALEIQAKYEKKISSLNDEQKHNLQDYIDGYIQQAHSIYKQYEYLIHGIKKIDNPNAQLVEYLKIAISFLPYGDKITGIIDCALDIFYSEKALILASNVLHYQPTERQFGFIMQYAIHKSMMYEKNRVSP